MSLQLVGRPIFYPQATSYKLIPAPMSGHSKWSQIKHKKAITDVKKGKIFSKLVREVMIASKTGGSTDANVRLRAAIERARNVGVPKDNIDRAVIRGSGTEQGQEFKEFLYEATGPGGLAILIEGITDSTNRSISEIKHLLSTHGGRIAQPGSLLWNFQKVGILEISAEQNPQKSNDDIELALLESGARDFSSADRIWTIETEFTDRERIRKDLEQQGITVHTSTHDYKSGSTIALEPSLSAAAESLLDALTDHDDVQEVYTNLKSL